MKTITASTTINGIHLVVKLQDRSDGTYLTVYSNGYQGSERKISVSASPEAAHAYLKQYSNLMKSI